MVGTLPKNITFWSTQTMHDSILRAVELGICKDKSEFIRWAIADKLTNIFKYPIHCPYCKSRQIIPVTAPQSSANFQCVDCSNTWDELFFRKMIQPGDV